MSNYVDEESPELVLSGQEPEAPAALAAPAAPAAVNYPGGIGGILASGSNVIGGVPVMNFEETMAKVVSKQVKEEVRPLTVQEKKNEKAINAMAINVSQILGTVKAIQAHMEKEAMPLETILTTEGMISLKWSVLENIETRADTATEREVLDSVKEDLVEQGHFKCESALHTTSLFKGFRHERHTLRQQSKNRLKKDLAAKDKKLKETVKYLERHIGGGKLKEVHLQILLNVAYVMCRYANEKYPVTGAAEEKLRSKAKGDLWGMAQQRIRKMDPASLTIEALERKLEAVLGTGFVNLH